MVAASKPRISQMGFSLPAGFQNSLGTIGSNNTLATSNAAWTCTCRFAFSVRTLQSA